jgi:hypothetical protein
MIIIFLYNHNISESHENIGCATGVSMGATLYPPNVVTINPTEKSELNMTEATKPT